MSMGMFAKGVDRLIDTVSRKFEPLTLRLLKLNGDEWWQIPVLPVVGEIVSGEALPWNVVDFSHQSGIIARLSITTHPNCFLKKDFL